jgi:hypothetical protein
MIRYLKNPAFGCRLLSFIFALSLITGRENIFLAFSAIYPFNDSIILITVGLLFLLLNLSAAIGLFWLKKFGFICAYIAIIFSTVFLSTIYLPITSKIFPNTINIILLFVINAIVLSYIIYLDILLHHKKNTKIL